MRQNWTKVDIAWLAGLIEGEGSIFRDKVINKKNGRRPRWIFSLEMNDKDVVEKAKNIFGYGKLTERPPHGIGKGQRYVWRIDNRSQVFALCAAIYPFMGQRRGARCKECLLEAPPVKYPKGVKRPR